MTDKFYWSATISAPQEYPVEIYDGKIGSENDSFIFNSMWGTINSGWGNGGGITSGNENAIPSYLEFTWFSIVEKKFYSGKWTLPSDKIKKLFNEGYIFNNQKETYNTFIIGLVPNGMVVLWLKGINQIEIGCFQAKEIFIDADKVHEENEYMFEKDFAEHQMNDPMIIKDDVKGRIQNKGHQQPSIFYDYRELYDWIPRIILPLEYTITSFEYKMCNGESEFYENNNQIIKKKRAIPYAFEISWKDKKNKDYSSRIAFTKDQNYWTEYLNNGVAAVPIDFDDNDIRKSFLNIDKKDELTITIKIDPLKENYNEWITNMYVEQKNKKNKLAEIIQNSGKY